MLPLLMDVSTWQHFIRAHSIKNKKPDRHGDRRESVSLPPHPQPASASAASPPAHHWAWYYFLESAQEITPLSWHHGAIQNTASQFAHKNSDSAISDDAYLHLCACKTSSQPKHAWICTSETVRVMFSVQNKQDSPPTKTQPAIGQPIVLFIAQQPESRDNKSGIQFLPWPEHLRVAIPYHRMSLYGPDKILEIQSLAVNREIFLVAILLTFLKAESVLWHLATRLLFHCENFTWPFWVACLMKSWPRWEQYMAVLCLVIKYETYWVISLFIHNFKNIIFGYIFLSDKNPKIFIQS